MILIAIKREIGIIPPAMETQLSEALSQCPGVTNTRILKTPPTPAPNLESVLNETIAFNYVYPACEIPAVIHGCMRALGFCPRQQQPVSFQTSGPGIEALYAGIFENDHFAYRIAISWLEKDDRLAVLHLTQLIEE